MSERIEAKGYGGTVSFDGQFISIRRGGLGRLIVGKGEKRIPLRSISAVQLKPASPMVNGFIEFSISGGDERRSQFGRQTFDAVSDENSVVFRKGQQPAFEALRAAVEQAIVASSAPPAYGPPPGYGPPPSYPPPPQQQPGLAAQLHQLDQLRQSGALSDQEFAQAKARLLAGG